MTTSATNELGKHPSKKVITELLEKNQQQKDMILVGLWRHLKTWGENFATNENNCLFEINEEMKSSLAERIGENLDHC